MATPCFLEHEAFLGTSFMEDSGQVKWTQNLFCFSALKAGMMLLVELPTLEPENLFLAPKF